MMDIPKNPKPNKENKMDMRAYYPWIILTS
jgi:hypothetical protein